MQIVRDLKSLRKALFSLRGEATESLAFVPTMGALHAGHMALVEEARGRAGHVAASIFVNPMQFGANEDLDLYPRQEGRDAEMLREAGCALLWLPGVEDIYPPGFATKVSVAGISDRWEGQARPGHFDGVATVVAKLFAAVRPDVALFGEKDFQQLAVIRRMTSDLQFGIEIVGVPTVRDWDGLALSSRNAYLSPDDRSRALALPDALEAAAAAIANGEPVAPVLEAGKQRLSEAGFEPIDYFALVDAGSLEPLAEPAGKMRLIAAAKIGKTRLIDNIAVEMVQ